MSFQERVVEELPLEPSYPWHGFFLILCATAATVYLFYALFLWLCLSWSSFRRHRRQEQNDKNMRYSKRSKKRHHHRRHHGFDD
jgi:hypothetical protein